MKIKIVLWLPLLSGMLCMACAAKKAPETIVLPPISAFSFGSDWGVVTTNYLRMRDRPSKDAGLQIGLTKGMVVEILSSTGVEETIEEETAPWYSVNIDGLRGWVFGAYLQIFNSKATAEAFAGELQ